uniref:Integrase catalytic domain-containing protein n=1 Tax=Fagus sylvatica TaxID=28930 RepID=A0A2N9G9X8_FAGSY
MATSSSSSASSTSSNPPGTISQTPILLLKDLVSMKLDATNYVIWKYQIVSIFESYSLLDMIDGTASPPAEYLADANGESSLNVNPLYKQWKARDQALKTLINATLSPSAITLVIGQTTTQGVWQALERRYTSLSRTHVLSLKGELDRVKKSNTETMTVYLDRVKEIRDKLGSVGVNIDDEDLLHVVLRDYLQIMILSALLCAHEKELFAVKNYMFFLLLRKNPRRMPGIQQLGIEDVVDEILIGAVVDEIHLAQIVVCQICGKTGHLALDCFHRMNFAYQGRQPPAKLAAIASTNMTNAFNAYSSTQSSWISDTGATNHFTPDISHIPDCHEYRGNEQVTVGNGQSLPINHTGNSQLYASSHLFKLRHVLHVPSMSSNLLSVHKFCKDNNASFHFDASKFRIKDLSLGRLLYSGLSERGLYPIHGAIFPESTSPQSFHTSAIDVSSSLWHNRLGHPQQIVLHHVLQKCLSLLVSNTHSVCSHCLAGKMHQLPFSKSVSITSRPLEIVHSDVWGPAPITSNNGTRFYVIFVDDFTKFTWFFPLHHKSQVLSSFMHFKSTMENLLSCTLKILRTDCGGGYSKHEFQNFCSSTGVLHQFTCPYTSQQNGVAERKHRHIVDKGLTLMSQASLPLHLWPYAFSTSVFLINRLPSPHRGFISPWERLFGSIPSYSSFRSFGCACYPLLRPYSKHKLLLRSVQCVFLGYPSNAKDFLCFDPVLSRFFVSRHVQFDETVYPFHNLSTLSSLHKIPTHSQSSSPAWLSTLLYFHSCLVPSVLGPPPPSILSSHTPAPTALVSVPHVPDPVFVPLVPAPVSMPPPINSDYLTVEPPSFAVAHNIPQWYDAMASEFFALQRQSTWSLVPSSPHHPVIGCHWVFKLKRNSDGSITRYKACFVDPASPSHVCFLHKSIYGLRQAPRAWFEKFSSHLLTIGFITSQADPSMFLYKHGSTVLYLLLYVDDIILTGNAPTAITDLITNLGSVFELKDLGPLKYFLGLQIDYQPSGFFVHQSKYAMDVLSRQNMSTCKPCSSPFVSSSKLSSDSADFLPDPTPYRNLVGALQYLTFTRPDLSFAVNSLCQHRQSPTSAHLPGPMHLTIFTDADWADNLVDRRSTTGFLVFLGNNLITWASKKQPTVSCSSTEAEYRSLAVGAAEVAWI